MREFGKPLPLEHKLDIYIQVYKKAIHKTQSKIELIENLIAEYCEFPKLENIVLDLLDKKERLQKDLDESFGKLNFYEYQYPEKQCEKI